MITITNSDVKEFMRHIDPEIVHLYEEIKDRLLGEEDTLSDDFQILAVMFESVIDFVEERKEKE